MIYSAELLRCLERAESICVLTGAGISAESGVPTFRTNDGLWSRFKPEELANIDAFLRNPVLVWEWYAARRTVIHEVFPNPGHEALASMERWIRDFTVATQNVDGLHARAGSRKVLELHGNIERSYCIDCGSFAEDPDPPSPGNAPLCKRCGGLLRPDVVWFGEQLPEEVFQKAEQAARRCSLFLSVGTSSVVYPAASLPMTARESGAYIVEINTERTELSSRFDETILGRAGSILPELLQLIKHSRKIHQ